MSKLDGHTMPVMEMARQNDAFREVLMTGEQMQIVLMTIPAGGEIGGETHEGHDQVLLFVEGTGVAKIGETTNDVGPGDLSFVPSGRFHNFKNTGTGPLRLITAYAPPEHAAGTHHESKQEADA